MEEMSSSDDEMSMEGVGRLAQSLAARLAGQNQDSKPGPKDPKGPSTVGITGKGLVLGA